jgi:hypothetical protein
VMVKVRVPPAGSVIAFVDSVRLPAHKPPPARQPRTYFGAQETGRTRHEVVHSVDKELARANAHLRGVRKKTDKHAAVAVGRRS